MAMATAVGAGEMRMMVGLAARNQKYMHASMPQRMAKHRSLRGYAVRCPRWAHGAIQRRGATCVRTIVCA